MIFNYWNVVRIKWNIKILFKKLIKLYVDIFGCVIWVIDKCS